MRPSSGVSAEVTLTSSSGPRYGKTIKARPHGNRGSHPSQNRCSAVQLFKCKPDPPPFCVSPCDSHPWPKSEPPGTAQRAQLPSCPPSLPPSLPHSNSSKQISPKPFNSTPAADSFINVLTFVTQLAFRCQRKRHILKDTFLASQMGRVPTVLRHTQTSCLCNYSFHTFSVLQGIIPMTVATVAA